MAALSLSGTWLSPMPVMFGKGKDGTFASIDGTMTLTLEKETRAVNLVCGDFSVDGKVNPDFTRIRWAGGSCWMHQKEVRRSEDIVVGDVPQQPNMLSDCQVERIIDRVNESINIWLLNESQERDIIAPPVRQTNENLRECLTGMVSEEWLDVLTALLDETLDTPTKTERIQDMIARTVRDPLVERLNDKIDVPVLTEGMEAKLLKLIVDKMLDQVVELSVIGMERTGFA